jgi:hypothetical protein
VADACEHSDGSISLCPQVSWSIDGATFDLWTTTPEDKGRSNFRNVLIYNNTNQITMDKVQRK